MRRVSLIVMVLVLLVAFATASFANNKAAVQQRTTNPLVNKVMQYAYPDEHNFSVTNGVTANSEALGQVTAGGRSPGHTVGITWYDYQHTGSMGPMTD